MEDRLHFRRAAILAGARDEPANCRLSSTYRVIVVRVGRADLVRAEIAS